MVISQYGLLTHIRKLISSINGIFLTRQEVRLLISNTNAGIPIQNFVWYSKLGNLRTIRQKYKTKCMFLNIKFKIFGMVLQLDFIDALFCFNTNKSQRDVYWYSLWPRLQVSQKRSDSGFFTAKKPGDRIILIKKIH
mgnify:CR=1 FL=1